MRTARLLLGAFEKTWLGVLEAQEIRPQ
jgi:hypothetical protein